MFWYKERMKKWTQIKGKLYRVFKVRITEFEESKSV